MNLKVIRPAALALAAASIVATATMPATAAVNADTEAAPAIETTMTVTGYDPATAAANGYAIVTDAAGIESSMPVTAAAQREDALARETARRDGRSYADGNCGRASLTTKPIASQGKIAIATSYSLSNGRKSFGHLWKVSGQSRLGTPFTESFSGANNFDSSWSATHAISLYGFSHGTNSLNLTNHAKLTNGSICTAKVVVNSW